MEQAPRVNILGVGISAINQDYALNQIDGWIQAGRRHYVSVCTVHTVMECQNDSAMRNAVNNAGMATPDGMPLVWLAKRDSEHAVELAVCQRSVERRYKHFFYGGAVEVPELLSAELRSQFPGLQVVGTYSPPYRDLTQQEEQEIIAAINQVDPDIIWVGLGTPKQDLWMARHRSTLNAPVLIGVGAAFDFHTKRLPQAPLWMQRSGLEWFFRLSREPSRLWYRYLVYNPAFIVSVLRQRLGLRRYEIETLPAQPP
jgi:N-acetylglucosaminyldiphosphoundecaprenol N-acetyl-beta-D-mannosaminyltransferase